MTGEELDVRSALAMEPGLWAGAQAGITTGATATAKRAAQRTGLALGAIPGSVDRWTVNHEAALDEDLATHVDHRGLRTDEAQFLAGGEVELGEPKHAIVHHFVAATEGVGAWDDDPVGIEFPDPRADLTTGGDIEVAVHSIAAESAKLPIAARSGPIELTEVVAR